MMNKTAKRRAFGQHFLKDSHLASQIAERTIEETLKHQCSALLEIGPGRGAITNPLLSLLKQNQEIGEFRLVEKDFKLAEFWRETAPKDLPCRVEEADFLDLPKEKWLQKTPLAVVSNLPYSAGTAILKVLAVELTSIPVMVLMFQAEVAKRLRAEAETKERGSLSLWIQNHWDVEKLFSVSPKSFSPPPAVNSEVVLLTRRNSPRILLAAQKPELWESLLRVCFAHRRKMLRSVLPWKNALELAAVDGTKRAEALSWVEWDRLLQAVEQTLEQKL